MPFFSLLNGPLLFAARREEGVARVNTVAKAQNMSKSFVFCSSPIDFIRGACNGVDESNCVYGDDGVGKISSSSTPFITDRLYSQLRLSHKWTFMPFFFSHDTKNLHTMTTNRMDYIMQILSKITSNITSLNRREKTGIAFFPTKLLETMMPFSEDKSRDRIYYEICSRIPLHLLYSDLDVGHENETEPGCSDTLDEFVNLPCMYARRLRLLLHDAVISFMSAAVPVVSPSGFCGGSPREEAFPQGEIYGKRTLDHDCKLGGTNIRPVHQFLPFPYVLPTATPIVLGFGIEDDGGPMTAASQSTPTERSDASMSTLTIQIVMCLDCSSADDQVKWRPDMIAFQTLQSLFLARFAVHGASSIEVCELGEGCRVVERFEFSAAEIAEAWERGCCVQGRFVPSPKRFAPNPPSATTEGSVITQHDPYCTLNGSSIRCETRTVETSSHEGACMGVNEEENVVDCALCEELDDNYDADSSILQKGCDNDVATEELNKSDRVATSSEWNSNIICGKGTVRGSEEVIELDIAGTQEVILSLAKELVEFQQQDMGLQQELRNYVSSLLALHASDNVGTASIAMKQQRKKKRHKKGNNCEFGFFGFLFDLFTPINEQSDGDDTNSPGQCLVSSSFSCICGDGLHTSFDNCVKEAVEIIQTLRSRLRALQSVTSKLRYDSMAPLNFGMASTNVQRKKGGIAFFASAIKCLTEENQRQRNTKSRKPAARLDVESNGVATLLQCTPAAHTEARCCIDDACEKLRTVVAWGHRRVVNMKFLCAVWREALGSFLEARAVTLREEMRRRSELHVDYVVSTAVLREGSCRIDTEDEYGEEDYNEGRIGVEDTSHVAKAEKKRIYDTNNNTTTTTNNNNNNIFADANYFRLVDCNGSLDGGVVNIERDGRGEKNRLEERSKDTKNAHAEVACKKKFFLMKKRSKDGNIKNKVNSLLLTSNSQENKTVNTHVGGERKKRFGEFDKEEIQRQYMYLATIFFILVLFGVITFTLFLI